MKDASSNDINDRQIPDGVVPLSSPVQIREMIFLISANAMMCRNTLIMDTEYVEREVIIESPKLTSKHKH